MGDHFTDFDEASTSTSLSSGGSSRGGYSEEIFSKKISAKYRTFFVDVKKNDNGHFVKISEKSRGGRKTTIMMDSEDLGEIISTLQEAKNTIES